MTKMKFYEYTYSTLSGNKGKFLILKSEHSKWSKKIARIYNIKKGVLIESVREIEKECEVIEYGRYREIRVDI